MKAKTIREKAAVATALSNLEAPASFRSAVDSYLVVISNGDEGDRGEAITLIRRAFGRKGASQLVRWNGW